MQKTLYLLAVLLVALLVAGPVAVSAYVAPVSGPALTSTSDIPSAPALPVSLAFALAVFGIIVVKDVATISRKFVRNAQAAQGDYVEGVKAAGAAWEQGAREGAENFATGVQAAIADGRFARGVAAAGAAKYSQNAEKKGGQRFGPGVAAAENDFARGVAPVLDTIRNITLPPRRPKGDPGNMQRSQAIATALRALKVGRPK